MGPIGGPETSVNNHKSSLSKSQKSEDVIYTAARDWNPKHSSPLLNFQTILWTITSLKFALSDRLPRKGCDDGTSGQGVVLVLRIWKADKTRLLWSSTGRHKIKICVTMWSDNGEEACLVWQACINVGGKWQNCILLRGGWGRSYDKLQTFYLYGKLPKFLLYEHQNYSGLCVVSS